MINQPSMAFENNSSLYLMYVTEWASFHAFADISVRNNVLSQVAAMRLDTHPSGCPDPAEISILTRYIRGEKFRIVRERGRGDSAAAEIQRLIDVLKRLEAAALQARPVNMSRAPWYRACPGLAGLTLMLFSPVVACILIWLPPDRTGVLLLCVYALLTAATESASQDKFAPQHAMITRAVLSIAAAGMALHYVYTTVSGV
ncbi:hypothetical protein [Pantoea ananatis]|uniref:hypothetical protein n=1 Tax=Pantoea ananas TaxID=553 RepID=UPI00301B038D